MKLPSIFGTRGARGKPEDGGGQAPAELYPLMPYTIPRYFRVWFRSLVSPTEKRAIIAITL